MRTFIIQQTYFEENDPWTGILDAAEFAIISTTNRQKVNSPCQLIFVYDMILPIKHRVDWGLIHQRKQTQNNRDKTRENKHRVDYDYKVKDKVILAKHTEYKYKTPYNGPFLITQCFNNYMLMLQCGAIKNTHNIHRIYPYKSDTTFEDYKSKMCMTLSTYE